MIAPKQIGAQASPCSEKLLRFELTLIEGRMAQLSASAVASSFFSSAWACLHLKKGRNISLDYKRSGLIEKNHSLHVLPPTASGREPYSVILVFFDQQ
jgi:hypothetical protein